VGFSKRILRCWLPILGFLAVATSACSGRSDAPSVLPINAPVPAAQKTLFGALIHTESCNFNACVTAVNDLNLDIVAIGFVPTVDPWSLYDKWLAAIPQQKVLALIALPTVANPPSPEQLAQYAAAVAQRYPEIKYFEILNEPNEQQYYPGGMNPSLYLRYFSLAAAAITSVNPGATVMGPAIHGFDSSYIQVMPQNAVIAVHPYGYQPDNVASPFATLRAEGYPNYWVSEWGYVDPVAMWEACAANGCGAAIYYQLQDSPDSPGTGLLDAQGRPTATYQEAKQFLQQRQALP